MDWLYVYYGRGGELLYIGVSTYPAGRAGGHRTGSKWWRFVDDGEVIAVPLSKSGEREREYIRFFRPLFNEQHRSYGYEAVIEFCARREAWDLVDDYMDLVSHGNGEAARLACEALGRSFPYSLHGKGWEFLKLR